MDSRTLVFMCVYSTCILMCLLNIYFWFHDDVYLKALLMKAPFSVPLFLLGLHPPGLRWRQYLYPWPPALCQHVRLTWPRPLTSTCKHSTRHTAQTQTHMHTQLSQKKVCLLLLTQWAKFKVARIIVPLSMWCVWECMCVWISLLSIVFPAVPYLHGSVIQTSCHPPLTDIHSNTHTHIVGVRDIAFHAAEHIAHEPIKCIINWILQKHTGQELRTLVRLQQSALLLSFLCPLHDFNLVPCTLFFFSNKTYTHTQGPLRAGDWRRQSGHVDHHCGEPRRGGLWNRAPHADTTRGWLYRSEAQGGGK